MAWLGDGRPRHYRRRIVVTAAELRARQVLRDAGIGPVGDLRRADSRVNEVWWAGPYIVRVCTEPETQRLTNEAAAVEALGPGFPYPKVVGQGRLQYAEWMVTERVPGRLLSEAWPGMDDAERTESVRQLAAALRLLHQSSPPHIPAFVANPMVASPHPLPPRHLIDLIDRGRSTQAADLALLDDVAGAVERLAPAVLPWHDSTLVHGDLHLDNVLWDGLRVTAVLDLEWSRPGPPDLDLDIFLRYCHDPTPNLAAGPGSEAADFSDVPTRLASVYPELFAAPELAHRLILYALSYDVQDLLRPASGRSAGAPDPDSSLHPRHRIRRLLDGRVPWIDAAVEAAAVAKPPRGRRGRAQR